MSESKNTTTIQVYIEADYMEHDILSTLVETDAEVFDMPEKEAIDHIFNLVKPKLKGTELGKKFSIQSIREYYPTPKVPTPPWLDYPEFQNFDFDYREGYGDRNIYRWGFFIRSIVNDHWRAGKDWILDTNGFGHPDMVKFAPPDSYRVRNRVIVHQAIEIPPGWIYHKDDYLSYKRIGVNPFQYHLDSHQILHQKLTTAALFGPQTHPVFYYALYLFWTYIVKQPLWFTCSYALHDYNDVHANSSISWYRLGAHAYRDRYALYNMLSAIFYPGSFALNSLDAQCKLRDHHVKSSVVFPQLGLAPAPKLDQDQNDDSYGLPPRHRVLADLSY